jgi:fatty-acyl-CoA synthase
MQTAPRTVGDFVLLGARRHPDRAALRDPHGAVRSYRELDERSSRLANALLGIGLAKGDRIAAWMGDGFEYVEVYLAAAKAGLIICPVNARLTAYEAAGLLGDADPRALVWTPELDEKAGALDAGLLGQLRAICTGSTAVAGVADYETLLAGGSPTPPPPPEPSDLLVLGYTSGTTGRPKGAMLTHAAVVSIGTQNAFAFRLTAYPQWGLTGSMSFVSVVPAHVLCALRLGGTVTIMGRWDPVGLLDTIRRHRLTFVYIASPLLDDVTAALDADRGAWTSLESVLHSASAASPERLAALHAVVGSRLVEGWGMTEHSGGLVTATSALDYLDARAGDPVFSTVGRPIVDAQVRVVDESGAELPHDGAAIGELLVASPGLMSGYWNAPEATAVALTDGWYHSGDLGTISPEGYVGVTERRTDLIVSGGANVYPGEVERCIEEIPGVVEVAVVGAPHPRWGQSVVAVVIVDEAVGLTEQMIVEHCRQRLAGYKKPSRVFLVPELPRTTSLKVARGELRELVRGWVADSGFLAS